MMNKRALICGISGQDGSYLASLLLDKGYEVYGTSRDAQVTSFENLRKLGIRDRVKVSSMVLTDFRSVLQALTAAEPTEIYNLAGQSSVGLSFEQPVETIDNIVIGTLNLLEAIRFLKVSVRFYSAGSSESFGNTGGSAADETTPFKPRSPYAVAKAAAFWQVENYREAYGLYACTGILFNHESPLRPERFVTQKIIASACRIARGSQERPVLGNLSIERDWGWAPDYVDAIWRMLQQENPEDIVIATGTTISLRQFVDKVYRVLGLDWQDHVEVDESLFRPLDINSSHANPEKASRILDWRARLTVEEVILKMIEAYQNRLDGKALPP